MTLTLSPAEAVLVQAATPSSSAPCPGVTSWDEVTDMARWHRLSGLLRRYLLGHGDAIEVPPAVMKSLRDVVRDTTKRNLQRQVELDRVLGAFGAEGIPAMVLKGAALLESVYPEVGLRPMNDLDILVPRAAIERAQALVQEIGYRAAGGTVEPDVEQKLLHHHHHFPLAKGGAFIELHHHVLQAAPPAFTISELWDRAVAGTGGVDHLVPCPEDLLLHVCIHFTQDRTFRFEAALGQLGDVAWIVGRHEIDWEALSERANRYGVGDWLFLALYSATTLFGDIVPQPVVAALQPASFRPDLGEFFVRQRVLRARTSLPLEQLSAGPRALLFPTRATLDAYVRRDERGSPSLMRLRARRARVLTRRFLRGKPWSAELQADIRLTKWILSLHP
jgi:hypothetical protein